MRRQRSHNMVALEGDNTGHANLLADVTFFSRVEATTTRLLTAVSAVPSPLDRAVTGVIAVVTALTAHDNSNLHRSPHRWPRAGRNTRLTLGVPSLQTPGSAKSARGRLTSGISRERGYGIHVLRCRCVYPSCAVHSTLTLITSFQVVLVG